MACTAQADTLRLATYNAELSAEGPGLILQRLLRDDDPKLKAVVTVIAALDADVLLITGIDYDLRQVALDALAMRLQKVGAIYPYQLALRPNTGIPTGFDLDANGQLGGPRDAQGYGRFAGQSGMAILSRLPIDLANARDFSGFLWAELPDNLMLPETSDIRAVQRLSSSGHWEVPILLPDGQSLRLLTYYATPPVFDGPEDRNGRRNHDETAFWLQLVEGKLAYPAPARPYVLLGQTNLDPLDGEGRPDAIMALLASTLLQNPEPRGNDGHVDIDHRGDPALDTAIYDAIGGLRVEQILPSRDLDVRASGVMWPTQNDPLSQTLATASRHRPVWIDITLP